MTDGGTLTNKAHFAVAVDDQQLTDMARGLSVTVETEEFVAEIEPQSEGPPSHIRRSVANRIVRWVE